MAQKEDLIWNLFKSLFYLSMFVSLISSARWCWRTKMEGKKPQTILTSSQRTHNFCYGFNQWFLTGSNFDPRGYLAMSAEIFGCQDWKSVLLNILSCMGQSPQQIIGPKCQQFQSWELWSRFYVMCWGPKMKKMFLYTLS